MSAAPKWAWVWYCKAFEGKEVSGGGQPMELWLCPDCAGEFRSDRARNTFLGKALDERRKTGGRR
jgi:hypothetical protein